MEQRYRRCTLLSISKTLLACMFVVSKKQAFGSFSELGTQVHCVRLSLLSDTSESFQEIQLMLPSLFATTDTKMNSLTTRSIDSACRVTVSACSIPSMVVLLVHARGSSNQLAGFYLQPSWLLLLVVVSFS